MNDNKDESKESAKAGKASPSSQNQEEKEDQPRRPEAEGKARGKKGGNARQSSDSDNSGNKGGESENGRKSENPARKGRESSTPPNRRPTAKRPAKKTSGSKRQGTGSPRAGSRTAERPKPTLRQPPVDREELQSKAWELYCADINEEGTSMFNEEEAEDLVRRSFILSDIFLRFRDRLYDTGSAKASNRPSSDNEPPQESQGDRDS